MYVVAIVFSFHVSLVISIFLMVVMTALMHLAVLCVYELLFYVSIFSSVSMSMSMIHLKTQIQSVKPVHHQSARYQHTKVHTCNIKDIITRIQTIACMMYVCMHACSVPYIVLSIDVGPSIDQQGHHLRRRNSSYQGSRPTLSERHRHPSSSIYSILPHHQKATIQ